MGVFLNVSQMIPGLISIYENRSIYIEVFRRIYSQILIFVIFPPYYLKPNDYIRNVTAVYFSIAQGINSHYTLLPFISRNPFLPPLHQLIRKPYYPQSFSSS